MNSKLKYLLKIFSVHLSSPVKTTAAYERSHSKEGLIKNITRNSFPIKILLSKLA